MMLNYRTARGWLRPEEREYLYGSAAKLSPGHVIVNIGVEFGASLVCFRQGAPKADIFGIDLDTRPFLREHPDKLGVTLLRGDSWTHLRHIDRWLGEREIDLLFVDGDHTLAGVTRDTAYTREVSPGGLAIFHDCYDYDDPSLVHRVCPGVNQAVDEWKFDQTGVGWLELTAVGTMRIFRRDV
jgi:cephalosporin hydroxylase